MYLRWRRLLPSWLRVLPVELPGRGARLAEGLVEDFDVLVARLCHEQAAVMAQGPFVLFGHSMGALLAHGMAHRLQSRGQAMPRAVAVSASPAPSRRDPARFAGKDNDVALTADLRRQGGTPEEVFASPEFMRLTLDTLAADYRVCQSFRRPAPPGLRLSVPVHAFGGQGDEVGMERVAAWVEETSGPFTLDGFEGGHFFIREQEGPFLHTLAERLDQTLDACARWRTQADGRCPETA